MWQRKCLESWSELHWTRKTKASPKRASFPDWIRDVLQTACHPFSLKPSHAPWPWLKSSGSKQKNQTNGMRMVLSNQQMDLQKRPKAKDNAKGVFRDQFGRQKYKIAIGPSNAATVVSCSLSIPLWLAFKGNQQKAKSLGCPVSRYQTKLNERVLRSNFWLVAMQHKGHTISPTNRTTYSNPPRRSKHLRVYVDPLSALDKLPSTGNYSHRVAFCRQRGAHSNTPPAKGVFFRAVPPAFERSAEFSPGTCGHEQGRQ